MNLETFYQRHKARHGTRIVVAVLFVAAAVHYFSWRVQVLNPDYPTYSTIFLAAELFALVAAFTAIFLQWKVRERAPANPTRAYTVDVLVPTYNEAAPLVRRTLVAALNIEYPHETWLLDDGNRPEMRRIAEELGVKYLARESNVGAKPGNLNNALRYTKGELVAVIDCDHIAQRDYIDRLIGYFDDPEVAYVQAPQDYYNTNAFQYRNDPERGLLWHDQSVFFHIGQAGRDYWNAATCCGTSTIVRRSVIDQMGGFPEATVTEDMHLAIRAQRHGWKSVYYPLPLAYGVAPVDLGEYQRQRLRWGQGNVQSFREEGLPFTSGLTLAQKICYSDLALLYVEGWSRLVFYLAPPLAMLLGVTPIGYTPDLPYYFLPYAIAGYLCFEELGRGNMRFHTNEQLAMARWPVFILATFAYLRRRIKWRVSSKEFIGHLQVYLLLPQFAVISLNLAALLVALVAPPERLVEGYSGLTVFMTAFWAALNVLWGVLVVRDAVRCAANKRADYRFVLPLPVDLNSQGTGEVRRATVDRISAAGMTLRVPGRLVVDLNWPITGALYIPAFRIPVLARIEKGGEPAYDAGRDETTLALVLEWQDQKLRDRLDMSLHACGWHRRLAWGGAYFHTPLEWIGRRLGLGTDRSSRIVNHRPVLFRPAGRSDEAPRLGMLLPSDGGTGSTFVAFEPLADGSTIEIDWVAGGQHTGLFSIGAECWPPEIVSAGPERVLAYTHRVNALPAAQTFPHSTEAAVLRTRESPPAAPVTGAGE